MKNLAPIVLFVFARPGHTRRTLDALKANELASQSDLFIYADGQRHDREAERVSAVRELVRSTRGFRSCTVIERKTNYGLAVNIIEGVTEMLGEHDRVIVLEDDLVTSPAFLTYMNDALTVFEKDDRVASIHGYVFPVGHVLPEAFFLRGADCWGWATWRRAWRHFNPDGQYLLDELKRMELVREFDFNGAYRFSNMLDAQIKGKNDSWAIRWHASAFLEGMLTLYPGRSLIQNIGFDGSGRHCRALSRYDTKVNQSPPNLSKIDVEVSKEAYSEIEAFFRRTHGVSITRLLYVLKKNFS